MDMILSNSCKMLTDKPTRSTPTSATLLDYIVINDICNDNKSGIDICGISDHLGVFSMIPVLRRRMDAVKVIRDMSHFDAEQFLEELNYEMSIISKNKSINGNELFRNFRSKLINIIDKNAPFKKVSRREWKLASNPRLTKELLKQIMSKNTLLKQFIKNQNEEYHKQYEHIVTIWIVH